MQQNNRLAYFIIFGIMVLLLAWIFVPVLSFATSQDASVSQATEAVENTEEVKTGLHILDVWSKPTIQGQKVGVAYLTLENHDDVVRTLTGVSSDVAGRIEIHTHLHEEGVMKMRKLEQLEVPAKGSSHFKPGGLHLMLFDLKQPLQEGESFELQFTFADGSHPQATASIRKPVKK